MQIGALIEKGPANWQILQQKDGYASLELAGTYRPAPEGPQAGTVYVRLVSEDDGFPVIPWQACHFPAANTWTAELTGIPAGGLYRLETCFCQEGNSAVEWSTRGDMVHHLGVGDLYVIAGQSNAAGYGKDPAFDPPELGVHVLRNSGLWDLASHPLNESTRTIHEANREGANPGNSPFITFGRRLKKELGYPVGLIQTALGGSPLKAWNPEEDGYLYRNMLDIIRSAGGRVRGVLWYQGCSDADAGSAESYLARFSAFVRSLRADLADAGLPFLTVQLNRYVGPADAGKDLYWGLIREAQRQAARTIRRVSVVPASDCGLSDEIHNSAPANIVLGERLARTALAAVYGRGRPVRAAEPVAAVREGERTILLTFAPVSGRLLVFGTPPAKLPFTVEDEAGAVALTGCELRGKDTVVLKLDRALRGRTLVHGAAGQNPSRSIPLDVDGYLPMLSFYGFEVPPA